MTSQTSGHLIELKFSVDLSLRKFVSVSYDTAGNLIVTSPTTMVAKTDGLILASQNPDPTLNISTKISIS